MMLTVVAKGLFKKFLRDCRGNVAVMFGLALVPVTLAAGGAVDYSRASARLALLQKAADAGSLAGVLATTNQASAATAATMGNLAGADLQNTNVNPTLNADGTVTVAANASVPTSFLNLIGLAQMSISVRATAAPFYAGDTSCILTLDAGNPPTDISLQFNGSPNVQLSGCALRSNTSLDCNGHSGNATQALAAGSATNCNNPKSGASPIPDVYASLASNITTRCPAGSVPGATWTPGVVPSGPGMITVQKMNYTEYHVCGALTLTGSGFLTGNNPSSDSVIIIENGSLNVADGSSVSTSRTAIVLTGDNSQPSSINLLGTSTLAVSPPTGGGLPWHGISLYQDPKLTNSVDNTWAPQVSISIDGVFYVPNSNITMHGSTSSNVFSCTKLVSKTFTADGSVNLNYAQTASGCEAIGLFEYGRKYARLVS